MRGIFHQAAQFAHHRYYLLAAAVTLTAVAIVFSDSRLHLIESAVPFKLIKDVGKTVGVTAVGLAILSMSYYSIRDAYAISRRMNVELPARIDGWAKETIAVLRFFHPFVGTVVFSVVLVHGYIMWHIWSAGNFNYSVESGLVSAAMLVVLACSGLFIRWMPKYLKLRHVHRMVGGAFLISLFIHKIIE